MFKVEKLLGKAIITAYGYIGGYIDFRSVSQAIDDIARSGIKAIDFHIHTEGGSVFDGNMIYNVLSSFKGEIDFYIDGIAASMGSVIIMSGARVHIAENGFIMIHKPSGSVSGTANDHINAAKLLRSIEKNFTQKLSDKTGKTKEQVITDLLDGSDHWIDADEAIAMKLANDKFVSKNGATTFTKDYAAQLGASSLYGHYAALAKETNQKPDKMKNLNLKLKLKEDATEPEAVAAIEVLEQRAQKAENEIIALRKKESDALEAEDITLVEAAISEQRIDAKIKNTILTVMKSDRENQRTILAGIPKRITAKDVVKNDEQPDEKLLKMSWKDLDHSGKLEELKAKDLEAFKAKFKEEFKKEWGS